MPIVEASLLNNAIVVGQGKFGPICYLITDKGSWRTASDSHAGNRAVGLSAGTVVMLGVNSRGKNGTIDEVTVVRGAAPVRRPHPPGSGAASRGAAKKSWSVTLRTAPKTWSTVTVHADNHAAAVAEARKLIGNHPVTKVE